MACISTGHGEPMYKLLVGIEHLMTGLQIMPGDTQSSFQFQRESASVVAILHDKPFDAYWPVKQAFLSAECVDGEVERCNTSAGEAEHYAKNVAALMQDRDQRSYDMQTYSRPWDYTDRDGNPTRYAPNEPAQFPKAVIDAMRRKHGADADKYLAMLRWDRDHWFYVQHQMYIGVEPDGYIHT